MASGAGRQPEDLHRLVEAAVNRGDAEALAELYEDDASMVGPDGGTVRGRRAIAQMWSAVTALDGRMAVITRYSVEAGDLALLSNEWHLRAEGLELAGITAEVARRQADGSWRYLIDHPMAQPVPD